MKGCFFITTAILLSAAAGYSQSYGLRFSSHEVVKEKRTSLNLTSNGLLCLKETTDISFDLYFAPEMQVYFGYVVRILMGDQNIDVVYNEGTKAFNFVIGEKITAIYPADTERLFKNWIKFDLQINASDNSIRFFVNDSLTGSGKLKNIACCQIFFGTNNYSVFQTADIPPMNLKDIRIKQNNKLIYYWPLSETVGNTCKDVVKNKVADVANANWIKPKHQQWQLTNSLEVKGNPSVAFDQKKDILYIVAQDSLFTISMKDMQLHANKLSHKQDTLSAGNQSIFDTATGNLYNFYIDDKKVSKYNFDKKEWTENFQPRVLTEFWQANKFISQADSSLYIIGGYGQLRYKNLVQRYDFKNNTWTTVKTQGDFFTPRYLAVLGTNSEGDSAYILGGYGSNTGYQVVNPRYYYDMFLYDVTHQSFKKLFEFKQPDSQFCFVNSMIVDEAAEKYYTLIYPNNKFNTSLQLIEGSLSSPSYQLKGDTIPYNFYDVASFADLFFSSLQQKLIVVTMYTSKDNVTGIKVYTIDFPPNALNDDVPVTSGEFNYKIVIASCIVCGAVIVLFLRRKKSLQSRSVAATVANSSFKNVSELEAEEEAALMNWAENEGTITVDGVKKSAIFLFGQFEVIGKDDEDLAKLFTPLLKEMFLLIATHTIRLKSGVSSVKLYTILWKGKSNKDAQNNRSVNMVKLKNILDKLGSTAINKEVDRWVFNYDADEIYIDFAEFHHLLETSNFDKKKDIFTLLHIIKRGGLLNDIDYEWLDDIKSETSNKVIDILHKAKEMYASDPELLTEIANGIFFFDPVDEEALHIKCRSLSLLGRHSLAQSTYNKFLRDYHQMYGVNYSESYKDVIG